MSSECRDAEQFLLSLHAAWKNLGLYSPTHPAATTALQNLRSAFEKLLGAREQITLGLLHDTLVIDGVPLTTKPELYQNFMTRLEQGESHPERSRWWRNGSGRELSTAARCRPSARSSKRCGSGRSPPWGTYNARWRTWWGAS